MQAPEEQNKIIERVKVELSKKVKLLSCKLHDFMYRKKLITHTGICSDYALMRLKIKYKHKKYLISRKIIVYPCDVIRYIRKTLDVIEEICRNRVIQHKSYKELEDFYYSHENGFSLSSIKSSIKRSRVAFEGLMSSGILVQGVIDFLSWLEKETRSFSELNFLYFGKYFLLDIEKEPISLFSY